MTTITTLSRVTAATTLGAAATAVVLLLMQSLIQSDPGAVDEPPPGATLTFLPLIKEEPPERNNETPEVPPKPEVPPPRPDRTDLDDHTGPAIGVDFTVPGLDGPAGPVSSSMSDGDALPVVKVRPMYPSRAQQLGIEGYVLVEFTIDELGRVVDIRVIEAEPRGTFERAALKAVERFRYKPRVVNGQPTPVSGVQHLVTFELSS